MVSSLFAGIPSLLVVIEEGWLPESLTRRTRPWGTYAPPMGGRHQIGMVAGFNSEWWPASNRNPGRHHVGIPGRNASESALRALFVPTGQSRIEQNASTWKSGSF